MVEGEVGHDQITRFLSAQEHTSKNLWQQVKSTVRAVQHGNGVLIFDDTIQEKTWTDESELMCWHFDHCRGRSVQKQQPSQFGNALKFRFVPMDRWFSSEENFTFITGKGRHFIAALKDSRLPALSEDDRENKRFTRVDELIFSQPTPVRGWLKGYAREVLVVSQVFKNKDDSTGVLHLVCSDLTCACDAIPLDLQKTVASGGVSQILEVPCESSQVPHPNRAHPKQPCFYGH